MSSDRPDSLTGLTEREKKVVQETWALAKTDIKEVGLDVFERFFKENPAYQQVFPSLKDIPVEEVRNSKKLLAHSTNVMYTLTCLVDNLEDPECLVEMLTKLGWNHGQRGVKLLMFHRLGRVLFSVLKDKLGPDVMNKEALSAWNKAYGVITSVVRKGIVEVDVIS